MSSEDETEDVRSKLSWLKTNLEAKGLRVNISTTKIVVIGVNLLKMKDSGKYPCSVGSNSIYCTGYLLSSQEMYWHLLAG